MTEQERQPGTPSAATIQAARARARLRDQRLQRSKVLSVLVALICVVLATIAVRVSDPSDEFHVLKGEVGTMMVINQGELTVGEVRVGDAIGDGEKIESRTSGMFVMIRIQLANRNDLKNNVLNKSRLLSDGDYVYLPYSSLTNIGADPGYVSTADFLYEVDPQHIDDLTLEIWSQGFLSGYHDRARIHLGITPDNAEKWRQAARDSLIIMEDYQQTRVMQ